MNNIKKQYVKNMFGEIAPKYNLLNSLMTFGQDKKWRESVIRQLDPSPDGLFLDVGAGTGDLSFEIINFSTNIRVVAADLSLKMVLTGKERNPEKKMVLWVIADAENLPFADVTFDGVVSGFLLRNVTAIQQALNEQVRVVKVPGRVVSLDTTPPKRGLFYPFIWFYLHFVIPLMGRLITGHPEAYTYLPDTTLKFLTAGKLTDVFLNAGLSQVSFIYKNFRTMAIHKGEKISGNPKTSGIR